MPDISKQRKNTTSGIQQLDQWVLTVAEHLPHLSKPQVTVLSLWSFGMATVKSCAITTVKPFLASLLEVKENTMRQRLREWCYDSKDKRGNKRVDVKVPSCFPFLMRWVMDWWQGTQVAIALDATALSDKFTVLSVSVVYRSCAIPVAWTITKGNAKGEWNKHWLGMLGLIAPVVPSDHTVLVLTDRGLYSPKLFAYICKIVGIPSCASMLMVRSVLQVKKPSDPSPASSANQDKAGKVQAWHSRAGDFRPPW